MTVRSDGYIEELFVNTTGSTSGRRAAVSRLQPADPAGADRPVRRDSALQRGTVGPDAERQLEGAMQRLRNLAVPESRIREVRETGANPRTLDWPAPATERCGQEDDQRPARASPATNCIGSSISRMSG